VLIHPVGEGMACEIEIAITIRSPPRSTVNAWARGMIFSLSNGSANTVRLIKRTMIK